MRGVASQRCTQYATPLAASVASGRRRRRRVGGGRGTGHARRPRHPRTAGRSSCVSFQPLGLARGMGEAQADRRRQGPGIRHFSPRRRATRAFGLAPRRSGVAPVMCPLARHLRLCGPLRHSTPAPAWPRPAPSSPSCPRVRENRGRRGAAPQSAWYPLTSTAKGLTTTPAQHRTELRFRRSSA